MKIEKISQSKIKVTLTYEDMSQWALDLENISYNSPQIQDLFWSVIRQAEDELGFVVDNSQIVVEAVPVRDNGFVLFVSKVDEEQSDLARFVRSRIKRTDVKVRKRARSSQLLVYKFELFDSLVAAVEQIQPFFEGHSMLYKYMGEYYLIITATNSLDELVDNNVSEYGYKIENPAIFEGKLEEYGELLIGNQALEKISSHF